MNNIQSEKYEFPPEAFEENPVKNEKFGDIYNFYRLLNVQKHAKKNTHTQMRKRTNRYTGG